jgi:hypothetical protein
MKAALLGLESARRSRGRKSAGRSRAARRSEDRQSADRGLQLRAALEELELARRSQDQGAA